jgi:predicted nucleic acid-binding protein
MMPAKVSPCGRFVVLDDLHIDRAVFDLLTSWASERDLRIQDAIQLALCAFGDDAVARNSGVTVLPGAALPTRA